MTLDAHTIDLEPFQYSGTNFTLIRMVNPSSPLMDAFSEYMQHFEPEGEKDNTDDNVDVLSRDADDDEETKSDKEEEKNNEPEGMRNDHKKLFE